MEARKKKMQKWRNLVITRFDFVFTTEFEASIRSNREEKTLPADLGLDCSVFGIGINIAHCNYLLTMLLFI